MRRCSLRYTLFPYTSIFRSCAWYYCWFFFFNDTATTEIYTLSLHDALPIFLVELVGREPHEQDLVQARAVADDTAGDRKSTRLNSSHGYISYAVFCLKKKKSSQVPNTGEHRAEIRTIYYMRTHTLIKKHKPS